MPSIALRDSASLLIHTVRMSFLTAQQNWQLAKSHTTGPRRDRASKDPSVPWEDVVRLVVDDLKISPDQLRLIAKVSLSTISRWRSGDAEPHLMMRGYIGESLAKYIREEAA
ncbi:hypothetical protein IVA94_31895 [Bradyrhizobium sp. 156]|uniref:hypothetical protein n=1 Tax=unclassified Bradyrhizobium TaxID=2631580 RepID=UPI001FFA8DFD|nr:MULTISPECIES: hypothetical protein [unclassified Bradyrhizobium]MCK1325389.1 hypothetical protein [Bradyrhizobium sp. 156]MCK1418093.1 hypothetical protein [Bradyrhizobium sp. CW4]